MSTLCVLEGEVCDIDPDPPLENYLWLEDADRSWNPDVECGDDEPLELSGLSGFDASGLEPEELDFLLVSLGAAVSLQCPDKVERLLELTGST